MRKIRMSSMDAEIDWERTFPQLVADTERIVAAAKVPLAAWLPARELITELFGSCPDNPLTRD